ncbi:conserved hypothetical protein [Echinococcus multilocularis]|uniref:Uncharacterized protein n=1 Tax=Echinococcus multilocularis TaxID=6211 RepID=A0A068Y268_ECHMU|nr:conserved hypothetical protein [Echinococcus multilocularis]
MDFSNAPIAVLEVDEFSCTSNSDPLDQPCEGVLKRSLSDPFDISGGLQLEASLEHLIWTFDDDVSRGLLDSSDVDESTSHRDTNASLDAIKSFWRISVAPIENPKDSYPLEKRPITFNKEDLHMADAESVSDAEFEAFAPNTELLLEREKLAVIGKEIVKEGREMEDDDTVATNSLDPFSSSSCESLPNSLSNTPPTHLPPNQQPTMTIATVASDTTEDQGLDASLRWASLQATLEAFKARHPTLPLIETPDWAQELERLSLQLLRHYVNELETETGSISELLVSSLAEREELRLFREVLDNFVVLHNTLQLRRRKAAEAVLANTTRSTLAHLKQHLSHSGICRQVPRLNSPESLIELTNLSKRGDGLSGSAVSLNLQRQELERMPRGHHIGEPIEFPGLRSALSRLSGLLTGQTAATPILTEDAVTMATRAVADAEASRRRLAISKVPKRLIEDAQKNGEKVLLYDFPWPMGRPEFSQSLKLQIPVPTSELASWLPPRLRIINQILIAALHESSEVNKLLKELQEFDPFAEAEQLQRTSKHLSASGFESAQVDSLRILYSSCEVGPRKTVSFNLHGTKELFKALSTERNGSVPRHTSPVA